LSQQGSGEGEASEEVAEPERARNYYQAAPCLLLWPRSWLVTRLQKSWLSFVLQYHGTLSVILNDLLARQVHKVLSTADEEGVSELHGNFALEVLTLHIMCLCYNSRLWTRWSRNCSHLFFLQNFPRMKWSRISILLQRFPNIPFAIDGNAAGGTSASSIFNSPVANLRVLHWAN
jgi:hypothetical protein